MIYLFLPKDTLLRGEVDMKSFCFSLKKKMFLFTNQKTIFNISAYHKDLVFVLTNIGWIQILTKAILLRKKIITPKKQQYPLLV